MLEYRSEIKKLPSRKEVAESSNKSEEERDRHPRDGSRPRSFIDIRWTNLLLEEKDRKERRIGCQK